jgi:hypothetical protein
MCGSWDAVIGMEGLHFFLEKNRLVAVAKASLKKLNAVLIPPPAHGLCLLFFVDLEWVYILTLDSVWELGWCDWL